MKWKVNVGRDFDDLDVAVIEEGEQKDCSQPERPSPEDHQRSVILWAIVALGAAFLAGAAIFGLWHGEFGALQSVWSSFAPFVGAVTYHYFRQGNDQSASARNKGHD